MPKPLPSPEFLRKLLRYEPETGRLFWRERTTDMFEDGVRFSADQNCRRWNALLAGKEAFTAGKRGDYKRGSIFKRTNLAHRVCWAIHFGRWPLFDVDHVNGDKWDNRIVNLRDISSGENMKNMPRRRDNSSGVTGVYWCGRDNRWCAHIRINGRGKNLGSFNEFDDAVSARKAAEREYNFSSGHGRS